MIDPVFKDIDDPNYKFISLLQNQVLNTIELVFKDKDNILKYN